MRIEKKGKKGYNIRIILKKMTEPNKYFKIHINHEHKAQISEPEDSPKHEDSTKPEERTLKTIIKDASRQLIASFIILVIGFFALNWSAYYQIGKNKINELRGVTVDTPLNEIAQTKAIVYNRQVLETSNDPEIQKKQIPALNMEIAPTDNRIIIPRIDQNIPMVNISSESLIQRNWGALEKEMQEALKDGVVHYPGTSLPGQTGNIVVTGHSSYFPWDPGRFKDVFALLHQLVIGDRIVVYYNQDKYIYEVSNIKIVMPDDIEVLKQTTKEQLTLITCTPVGTNLKRLIVMARPISKNGQMLEGVKILR